MPSNLLSKSKYLDGLQCPKLLWTLFHEPEKIPETHSWWSCNAGRNFHAVCERVPHSFTYSHKSLSPMYTKVLSTVNPNNKLLTVEYQMVSC